MDKYIFGVLRKNNKKNKDETEETFPLFKTSNRVKGSVKVITVKKENINRSEEDILKRYKKAFHLGIIACIAFLFIIEIGIRAAFLI